MERYTLGTFAIIAKKDLEFAILKMGMFMGVLGKMDR